MIFKNLIGNRIFLKKLLIFVLSLFSINFIVILPASAAVTVSATTQSLIVSFGGGSGGTSDCASNTIVTSVSSPTVAYSGYTTLTQTTGSCGTLASNGLTIASTGSSNLSTFGSSAGTGSVTASCGGVNSTSVITGARVYKTGANFSAGLKLFCGTLPAGGTWTLDSTSVGDTTPATYEDLKCDAGSVMNGLNMSYGSILDKYGLHCAQIQGATQSSISISPTSGAFGTSLSLSTSGGSGSGAVTYASVNGTTSCSVSGATITASSSGTCLITATKASDTNYAILNSPQTTVTFSQTASTSTISMASANVVFRQTNNLTAVANVAGKVSFKANNVWISGCRNLPVSAGNSYTAICPYRPLLHGYITVTVTLTPTNAGYLNSSASTSRYYVKNRTNTR